MATAIPDGVMEVVLSAEATGAAANAARMRDGSTFSALMLQHVSSRNFDQLGTMVVSRATSGVAATPIASPATQQIPPGTQPGGGTA